jgi:hypothetical protein
MSAEWAIQTAVFNKLNTALSVSVYSNGNVPDNTEARYVVIGDDTHIEWDTDGTTGFESTITVHSWDNDSVSRGMKAIKELMGAIYTALHRQSLTITGYQFTGCDFEFSETFIEADGVTRHGVQRFRIYTTAN